MNLEKSINKLCLSFTKDINRLRFRLKNEDMSDAKQNKIKSRIKALEGLMELVKNSR